jgi:Restriction endonuclease fold toxin 7
VVLSLGNQTLLEDKTGIQFTTYLRNPQTHNSYGYAGNNPIVNKDSSGQYVETAFDAVMFANSANTYRENPSFANGVGVVLDAASLALPIVPAVGGTLVRQTANIFAGYSPQQLGRAGELASGVVTGIKERFLIPGTNRVRIPDATNQLGGYIAEVKNVRYQGLTQQLKDSLQIARDRGLQFRLYVRESTQLSKPLQQAVDNGSVQLNRMSDKSIQSAINKSSKEK